ncbi:MAG: LPS export ABC transporter ATP-binding protein [Candidatus Electrothrix aestuarii]|jgi:lipopolysaccharide export system ATP-binding protein|uniref:LPS export ABC transporter ATP-binding protein n=1 Tax=Candidatus Electrothrix aestuarii TaxID=3062594 RepID=A0AAU8LZ97_9BACT|nr:LPS export ABC transporter ATP-binding protein [Candidatus Electrothrix aestuarii]WPD23276.1 MAG: LPS export ABC transporter ATP-binding protein [Candidatus Electrothrix sp. GW3-3]
MEPVSILETRNLVKEYRARRVVDQVNLKVQNGSIVGLLGPNGAGKTTTFYSIVGFIRPTAGAIFLDNREIQGLPIHRRASRGITYLAQEPSVFKKLTVEENVRIVLEPLGLTRNEINNRISELMAELKIEYLAKNKGHALSGGERRRVEIMRALATRPRFILLDEPFAGVDPLSVADLQQIIRGLKEKGLGVLISDHNVRETLQVCDFAYIMNAGQILTSGAADDIIQSELAKKMYLGENFTM